MGQRVSSSTAGVALNVGRGVGVVDIFSPKQEDRNTPAAAAAERVMKLRRVSRFGNITERDERGPWASEAADRARLRLHVTSVSSMWETGQSLPGPPQDTGSLLRTPITPSRRQSATE